MQPTLAAHVLANLQGVGRAKWIHGMDGKACSFEENDKRIWQNLYYHFM